MAGEPYAIMVSARRIRCLYLVWEDDMLRKEEGHAFYERFPYPTLSVEATLGEKGDSVTDVQ
jgi:hypothetical protein